MTKTKDRMADWISRRWHKTHNWKTGTGRFLKRIMNRRIRHEKY
jgi:hypothetical protein